MKCKCGHLERNHLRSGVCNVAGTNGICGCVREFRVYFNKIDATYIHVNAKNAMVAEIEARTQWRSKHIVHTMVEEVK